ncbi:MAG: glycerophosphodiester phosphodiesterase [Beijerinckiaceae bacterium]|nr:glycerophosphodiester phosphodiesterase [Beijerinckiaceae bacterium]
MRRRIINAPGWLIARPAAHRGLHSGQKGLVENTPAAAAAAIAGNYAIECDVQVTRDGEAVVFHDGTLERLMLAEGRLDAFTAGELRRLAYRDCGQTIVSLADFLAGIGGRTPVIVEIKSNFDGDMRLAGRALAAAEEYSGPLCLKSFDPAVLTYLRRSGVRCPLGLVAQASYENGEWAGVPRDRLASLADLRDFPAAQPDFLSWNAGDLPHAVPLLCREGIGMPVMTWVVRSAGAAGAALLWADQIIFEGFEP